LNPAEAPAEPKKGWWGLNIVDHCATGTNYKTGKIGTRICFFGTSWYGQVGKSVETFDVAINKVRERLARYPQFAKLPVEIHEFAVLRDEKRQTLYGGDATEWAASWMVAVAEKVYQHRLPQVFQWNTTSLGVPNPRANVLSLLERMHDGQHLATQSPAPGEIGCLAGGKNGGLDLLIFRHKTERANEPVAEIELSLYGKLLGGKKWKNKQANLVDADHSNFIRTFHADAKAAGIKAMPDVGEFCSSPVWQFGEAGRDLFERNRKKYESLSQLASSKPPAIKQRGSRATFSLEMMPQSVIYLRLEPR
jgi:xylan 1,4-beta-xylosidase